MRQGMAREKFRSIPDLRKYPNQRYFLISVTDKINYTLSHYREL